MAEIKTENIIYNLETKKNSLADALEDNAKKVTSLDKDIKETSQNSDKAFEKMGTSAKAYGEKLAAAEQKQKQLSRTIQEQQRITFQFRNELLQVENRLKGVGKNTVQFQMLTKEANKLKEAIRDNNVALQELRLDKSQVDANVQDLQRMAKGANDASKGLGNASTEISNMAQSATRASGPLGNVTGILSRMGPIGTAVAVGIGAIGAAFLNAKNTIQTFGDDVDVFMAKYEFRWRKFRDNLAEGFVKIVSGEGAENIGRGGGFDDIARQAEARKQRKIIEKEQEKQFAQLKRDEFTLQDFKIANIEKLADLERVVQDKRLEFQEKLSEKGVKDLELAKSIEDDIKEIYRIRIKIQEEENRITVERNKLTISGRKESEIEAQNRAKINELRAQESTELRTIAKLKRESGGTSKDKEKELRIETGLLEIIRSQIAEQRKLIGQAGDVEQIFALEAGLFQLEGELQEIENLVKEYRRRLENPNEADKLTPIDALFDLKGDNAAFEKAFQSLNESLSKTKIRTPDIIAKKQLEQEVQVAIQVYSELTRSILAQDVERKDRQIDIQRERLNEFRRLAEFGNAEQLQLEEERLNKMIVAREQAAQRERQIASLQVAAANAVSIAQGITAVTAGFAKGVVPGIAASVALAATIGATILAIRNSIGTIPAFAEGTEYVGLNGAPKGKDTIHARLDEGERVVSKKDNRELAGISNKKLVQVVKEYRLNNMRFKDIWTKEKPYDNSELLHGINRTNRLLEGLDLHANVNEYGLNFGIGRAQKAIKRKRNLSR